MEVDEGRGEVTRLQRRKRIRARAKRCSSFSLKHTISGELIILFLQIYVFVVLIFLGGDHGRVIDVFLCEVRHSPCSSSPRGGRTWSSPLDP